MTLLRLTLVACLSSCAWSLRVGLAPMRPTAAAATHAQCARLAAPQLPVPRGAAAIRMQLDLDDASKAFYEEYVETDPVTGEQKSLSLDEKEKLYLECLDAFYNENGKALLSDEEYDKLKLDLDFDGSKVAVFSADEIKFVLANKRFKMGKAIMNDAEYDTLRKKLKDAGSLVVIHDAAKCSVDDGICKTDLVVDAGKTRLLYFPGTAGGLILSCELACALPPLSTHSTPRPSRPPQHAPPHHMCNNVSNAHAHAHVYLRARVRACTLCTFSWTWTCACTSSPLIACHLASVASPPSLLPTPSVADLIYMHMTSSVAVRAARRRCHGHAWAA